MCAPLRYVRSFLHALLGVVLAGFLLAIAWSRVWCGYWFIPPDAPPEAASVVAVEAFWGLPGLGSWSPFTDDRSPMFDALISRGHPLIRRQRSGDAAPKDFHSLSSRFPEITLLLASNGIPPLEKLCGIGIDARTASGEKLRFIDAASVEKHKHRIPRYQVVFRKASTGLELVRCDRFFYNAGLTRHLHWYFVWPAFVVVGTLLLWAILAARFSIRRVHLRRGE